MKKIIAITAFAGITACSNAEFIEPTLADAADVGGTLAVLSAGGVEFNPLLTAAGTSTGAVIGSAVVAKVVTRNVAVNAQIDPDDKEIVMRGADAVGWLGGCNAFGVLAGLTHPIFYGAGCAALSVAIGPDYDGDFDE